MGILLDGVNGFYGAPSSTLDWCEENHAVSHYISEFWNTISNVVIIAYGVLGLMLCQKHFLDTRFHLAFLLLTIVGVGSWSFHQTLLYEMQLLDELPMIYGSALTVYCVFRNLKSSKMLRWAMILYCIGITFVYVNLKVPIIQHAAFGIMMVGSIVKMINERDRRFENTHHLLTMGILASLIGFTFWNIDNIFCTQLRQVRNIIIETMPKYIGSLVASMFQLHAVWHILSGAGSYCLMLYLAAQSKPQKQVSIVWKYCWTVPTLEFAPKTLRLESVVVTTRKKN